MTQTARRLQAERLQGPAALREAQALRYRVFSAEFDAKLNEIGFAPHGAHNAVIFFWGKAVFGDGLRSNLRHGAL